MRSSLHIADQKWLVLCAVMLLLSAAAAGQGASPTPTPSESIFQRAVEKVKVAETLPPDSEKYHQQAKSNFHLCLLSRAAPKLNYPPLLSVWQCAVLSLITKL